MPLVASTIPNLVSGVSQQPAPSRLRTSGEIMENAFPSIVSGLMKRPPTEFIADLSPGITVGDTAAVHMIDRSADERYILVCGDGDLELYDDTGVQQTVTFPDGKAYLPATDPGSKLRFVTVADTTFILNTDVTVTAAAPVAETRQNPFEQASIFVKRAVASVAYAIYINGVLAAQFITSDNTTAGTALEGTAEIAQGLAADAVSKGHVGSYAIGTTVIIPITAGDTVDVWDQFGGAALQPYVAAIQEFEDLPPSEVVGRLVKVQGDLEDQSSAYWVEYNEDGVWTETYGWEAKTGPDTSTMPHVLVKTAPNTFEFRRNTWTERLVGDDDSNPQPTFVGSKINNMFLFKGRLGFLSEENVILSEVAVLENFYLTTVVQNINSDPIDVASATGRVSTLYHTATFSNELILFSDKQQFRLTSGNVLSGETVGIVASTAYPCSTTVAPVTVGSSAFFVHDGATHASARELQINSESEIIEGEDISVQIPRYIPTGIKRLVASSTAEVLLALPSGGSNEIYVHKWYTANRRKVQSAWSKWIFDPSVAIVGLGFIGNFLYLVYKVGSDLRIDRMNVSPVIDLDLLLDHQIDKVDFSSITYDLGTDLTTIVLPHPHPATFEFYKTDADAFEPYSESFTVSKVNDTTYTIQGDVTADQITAGVNYEFVYQFSNQYLREENSDGESSIQDGRLQLRYFSVIYTDTSYFEAHVTPSNGATKVSVFNGRTLADPDNVTDLIPRDTGEFKFPVFAQNEDVTIQLRNDQPYRCAFGSIEWTAMYNPKARRV